MAVRSFGWQNRGWLEISIAILTICQQAQIKTKIMYEAKVNTRMLKRYIDFLKRKGLLSEQNRMYSTTKKGMELVSRYKHLATYLE